MIDIRLLKIVEELAQDGCAGCDYAVRHDEGYSDYTVMGTEFYCALSAHPDDGFDLFHNTDWKLLFGRECEHRTEGTGVDVSVDGYFSRDDHPAQLYAQRVGLEIK